jgi:hypothetical protein
VALRWKSKDWWPLRWWWWWWWLWWYSLCTLPTFLVWIFTMLAFRICSPQVDMSLQFDTLSWFWGHQSLLFHLNATCLVTGAGGTFDGTGSVTTVLFTVYIIFSSVWAFCIQTTASWVITKFIFNIYMYGII